MLTMGGRLILIKSTLCAIPVYAMMALDIPVKVISAIEKICRGFLWKGKKVVSGRHCLVAWREVCAPYDFGGLGIPNLRLLNIALQAKWLWLHRSDHNRPWSDLVPKTPSLSEEIFEAATSAVVGNGKDTSFWTDPWLSSARIKDLAPNLLPAVRRADLSISVADALQNHRWASQLDLGVVAQYWQEFFQLWNTVNGIHRHDGDDTFRWRWSPTGTFSAKSAYAAFFGGREHWAGSDLIWKSKAPLKCKVFLWLACRERCWTADRLQSRGMDHPAACPFCDQQQETINHLMMGCPFVRDIWHCFFLFWGKDEWTPSEDRPISSWWADINLAGKEKKDLARAVTLICWETWKHRNCIVFDNSRPDRDGLLQAISTEFRNWSLANLFSGTSQYGASPNALEGGMWRDTG